VLDLEVGAIEAIRGMHDLIIAAVGCSWTAEESQVESCEHQDNANIHCQPFPESVSEEHEIHTDYNGGHRHHVKHDSYLSVQGSVGSLLFNGLFNALT